MSHNHQFRVAFCRHIINLNGSSTLCYDWSLYVFERTVCGKAIMVIDVAHQDLGQTLLMSIVTRVVVVPLKDIVVAVRLTASMAKLSSVLKSVLRKVPFLYFSDVCQMTFQDGKILFGIYSLVQGGFFRRVFKELFTFTMIVSLQRIVWSQIFSPVCSLEFVNVI